MKIAEVCKQFDLTADTLRYYEKIQLMEPVKKDSSGQRNYDEHDLRRINFIKCMRTAGLSIENIKLYVDLFNEGEHTIPDRKQILINQKHLLADKMSELQRVMDYLNNKIDNYEETLVKRELERRKMK
ncbi:MAG: MerR family transcriptional regulator [Coprobacillus sp.]